MQKKTKMSYIIVERVELLQHSFWGAQWAPRRQGRAYRSWFSRRLLPPSRKSKARRRKIDKCDPRLAAETAERWSVPRHRRRESSRSVRPVSDQGVRLLAENRVCYPPGFQGSDLYDTGDDRERAVTDVRARLWSRHAGAVTGVPAAAV